MIIINAAIATALAIAASSVAMPAAEGEIRYAGFSDAVPGSYIVVLREAARIPEMVARHGGVLGHVYDAALHGFSAQLSPRAARRLAADRAVAYVQADRRLRMDGTQSNPPSWGLNRIDQRNMPLDSAYTYPNVAANVRAYILDTGIRFSHVDFGGRAVSGYDAIDGGSADDCHGHGTHVAGTVGGAAHGVAKGITLVAVRVLACDGYGSSSQIIAGINWVTADHDPGELAVANMSLGGGIDSAMDTAVRNSISDGVTYSVSAGNDNGGNACNKSPARVTEAITVGATSYASNDPRASYSNIGTCLDLFAPGTAITSAYHTSNTAAAVKDGTSMAAPHVTGAAALILSVHPTWTPLQVRNEIINDSTAGKVTNAGTGSPNRLLFVDNTPPPVPTVYISGPGTALVKQLYTYTAVHSNFSSPAFTWSERFCDDYAATVCSSWATITGLGSTFNRVLGKDCSTQEKNFQVSVIVRNYDGYEASDQMMTYLCELA